MPDAAAIAGLEVRPVTGRIGAEIAGVDLKAPIDEALAEALRAALYRHHVLFLRGQHLDIPGQKRLTGVFGPPIRLPYVEPTANDPLVVAVLKTADERNVGVFGGDWHADFSFLDEPPAGSVLSAVTIPPVGGDTLWANMVAAYEALPDALRRQVAGRAAIHVGKPYGVKHAPPEETRAGASIRMTRGDPGADRETARPAVLVHPESGAEALNVNPIYTTRLEGLSEAESRPLLEALYKHCTRPEFCCRFRWSAGAVAVWDNRTTLHYAVNDYDGFDRLLYRTTFGERTSVPGA